MKFWHRAEWTTHKNTTKAFTPKDGTKPARGRGQAAQGKNIMSGFIEDENGNAVDGHCVTAIRAHARAIWVSLGKLNLLPATWGKADSKAQQEYRQEMRAKFPELSLCDNNWKADQIATDTYPSWYKNHPENFLVVKEEPHQDASTSMLSRK